MRSPYKNANILPKEGDVVQKHHLWDGTHNAGKLLPKIYRVVKLHSVDPKANACWDRTYAELDDGTYSYVWNLSFVSREDGSALPLNDGKV